VSVVGSTEQHPPGADLEGAVGSEPGAASFPAGPGTPGARLSQRVDVVDLLERYGILVVWAAVIVFFSLTSPTFLTVSNLSTIFGTQAVLIVLAIGLLIPLTVGEYDLSLAANAGFSAVLVAVLSVNQGWPIGIVVPITLAAGVAIGFINAGLVVWLGVSSFVATLGTGTLLTGFAYGISNSVTITGIPQPLVQATTTQFLDLPLTFYYGLATCIGVWYMLHHTPLGRHLVFVGEGREVARLTGLPVARIRAGSLVACALIASGAGILQAGTVGAADPGGGSSFLLPAFASAFLGATAIRPGRFNPWGTFVAVYFLVTGITGLELLGYTGWVEQVFYGGSLVAAVSFGRLVSRRRSAAQT
jgi:ribose transport system permease protein